MTFRVSVIFKLEPKRIIPVAIDKEYEENPGLPRLEGLQRTAIITDNKETRRSRDDDNTGTAR